MLVYIALALGSLFLYLGGKWLLDGVTELGLRAGWSKAMIGLILVSLGTSAPELFVSVFSSLQGHGALAAGNVVGSNIINIALVLGIAASFAVLPVESVLRTQMVILLAISLLTFGLLLDNHVSRLEGVILLASVAASILLALRSHSAQTNFASEVNSHIQTHPTWRPVLLSIAGILTLIAGAEGLIWSGVSLATQYGIAEELVALTVTAIGTSLPEIAATVVAVARRETNLAIGNVVGSNLLNLGLVLGASALVNPLINIHLGSISLSYFLLLAFVLVALAFVKGHFSRWYGIAALSSYGCYVVLLLTSS